MVNVPFYIVPFLRQEDIQRYIQSLQQAQATANSDYNASRTEGDKSGERLRRLKTIMSRDTSELSGSEDTGSDTSSEDSGSEFGVTSLHPDNIPSVNPAASSHAKMRRLLCFMFFSSLLL